MTILQTADLKKYYGQGTNLTKALDGVDLSVEQGEFLAVVGTSGSGKSTLLHMMGGLDTPTSGSIKAVSYTHLCSGRRGRPCGIQGNRGRHCLPADGRFTFRHGLLRNPDR